MFGWVCKYDDRPGIYSTRKIKRMFKDIVVQCKVSKDDSQISDETKSLKSASRANSRVWPDSIEILKGAVPCG